MIRQLAVLGSAAFLTGCGSQAALSVNTGPAGSVSTRVASAHSDCTDALPHSQVIGWTSTTVSGLRSYQFGGPVAHVPLKTAFATLSGRHRAAWCVVREAPDSVSLWGVVAGRTPRRAISVTGPGQGRFLGHIDSPPQVP